MTQPILFYFSGVCGQFGQDNSLNMCFQTFSILDSLPTTSLQSLSYCQDQKLLHTFPKVPRGCRETSGWQLIGAAKSSVSSRRLLWIWAFSKTNVTMGKLCDHHRLHCPCLLNREDHKHTHRVGLVWACRIVTSRQRIHSTNTSGRYFHSNREQKASLLWVRMSSGNKCILQSNALVLSKFGVWKVVLKDTWHMQSQLWNLNKAYYHLYYAKQFPNLRSGPHLLRYHHGGKLGNGHLEPLYTFILSINILPPKKNYNKSHVEISKPWLRQS